jgi:hypothetical protein
VGFRQPVTTRKSGRRDGVTYDDQASGRMIISNPVIRLALKAMSACGLMNSRRGTAASRSNRVEQGDSPFVLVACAPGGRWGVFQQDFDTPRASFDELQEACDYANELARTRKDSMVLIRKRRDSAANPDSSMAAGTI